MLVSVVTTNVTADEINHCHHWAFFWGGRGGGSALHNCQENRRETCGGGVIYLSLTLTPPEWLLH